MRIQIGALAMMTMACTTMESGDEIPRDEGASEQPCNADGLNDLVGRPATQELGAEAVRRSHSRILRWIQPGDAVTMDFRQDRLNISLDAQNRVESFQCG